MATQLLSRRRCPCADRILAPLVLCHFGGVDASPLPIGSPAGLGTAHRVRGRHQRGTPSSFSLDESVRKFSLQINLNKKVSKYREIYLKMCRYGLNGIALDAWLRLGDAEEGSLSVSCFRGLSRWAGVFVFCFT